MEITLKAKDWFNGTSELMITYSLIVTSKGTVSKSSEKMNLYGFTLSINGSNRTLGIEIRERAINFGTY